MSRPPPVPESFGTTASAVRHHTPEPAHGSLETFGGPQRYAIAHLKAGKIVIPNMLSVMLGKSVLF